MSIRDELIGELLEGQDPATVMRQDGLLGALMNRLMAAGASACWPARARLRSRSRATVPPASIVSLVRLD